ncbi:MAG TPA: hypothetical protein VE860_24130, partial [Chthoniobacterales bacterium]|nr:hypothetical protein [Chthoniobacterales bacterium]
MIYIPSRNFLIGRPAFEGEYTFVIEWFSPFLSELSRILFQRARRSDNHYSALTDTRRTACVIQIGQRLR